MSREEPTSVLFVLELGELYRRRFCFFGNSAVRNWLADSMIAGRIPVW